MRTAPKQKPILLAVAVAAQLALLAACPNDHVFIPIPQCSTKVIQEATPIATSKAADILIVVDNSGSMCEEQENLVTNFYDPNCPIADLKNIPEEYRNPDPATVQVLAQNCGFIQILAAYENDFRVGVITTDVAPCDNRLGISNVAGHPNLCDGQPKPDWGRRPQRGCLQKPLGEEKRFISRDDEDDIGIRFRDTLTAIQTLGSPYERGLDAMRIFLSPAETKTEGCEDDLASFIREDASLVVIFLTDEDDCSHPDSEDFPDENAGDACDSTQVVTYPIPSNACYEKRDALSPVQPYVDFLQSYKGPLRQTDVRVAVIAGGLPGEDGIESGGCLITDGVPDAVCTPSLGSSNYTDGPVLCNPANLAAEGKPPCCVADGGNRYFEFASGFGAQALSNSICYANFRSTMVSIAQFAAATDKVDLANRPASPAAIIVKIKRSGSDVEETVARIPDGEDPAGRDGWQLEGDRTIRFYGAAKPQPGDEVTVDALATLESESEECTGDFGQDGGEE